MDSGPIMLVEDSDTQAMQLCHLLEEAGWSALRASSGEAALEQMHRQRPSLVIVDYHLPGMLGDELCRRIRMNADTRGIPILMLTAEETVSFEPAGLDSGADDYLPKSIPPDILVLRVRSLLRAAENEAMFRPEDAPFRRARLLAIDDSPTYLQALSDALNSEGYEVTEASTGSAGLACIARHSFDCVIVDLVMPDLDGIEVCRRISSMKSNMQTPLDHPMVIMLTSRESREDMTRGLEAGADDFVGKSSDTTVLKARVRALLRRKLFQDENRRIREQLLRKELETRESRAARDFAETRAVLADELERKNKELEAFSYSVSHDLRAPLRSIAGFSRALIEEYSGQLDVRGQDYLRRVGDAAQRMGDLIDDLLQLSRVGRADLRRKPVDLSALVHRVLDDLRAAEPDRAVEALIGERVMADGDPRLLQIVLENLLGNAWKFTAKSANASVEFGSQNQDGIPVYFVRDNGAGFNMEYAEKLFRPFQRLHSDTQFPGTGIGLATVKRIVERHSGRLWAEAQVNQGATFFWTLAPLKHLPEEPA